MTFVAAAIGGAAGYGIAGTLTGAAIGAGIGGMIGGGSAQAKAAKDASQLQYQATTDAARQQREMFDILNEQQKPYREAGYGALTKINDMLPQFTRQFTPADLTANLAPNYEFMRQQGLGATAQGANVASPGSNVDLAKTMFAENYAKGAYQDALTNWRNQQTDIFNRLSGIAGIGQTAQGQAQNLGSQTSTNLAQLGIGGASALGAGQVGAANAYGNTVSQLGNAGLMYSLFNKAPVVAAA
jgi:hypothetical protein